MYTDEDIDEAVKQGIFSKESVVDFRAHYSSLNNSSSVDEEHFRLVSGFNDIFVVIASVLLLFSSYWALSGYSKFIALCIFPALAWVLAEFFVRKRRMALPAIVLLISFVGGIFALSLSLFESISESTVAAMTALTVVAAYIHWLRFKVPITVAAGTAAAVGFIVSFSIYNFPELKQWASLLIFTCGILSFTFAMYWDASDLERVTNRSDVAFWIHLLSAPMIVHPVFSGLGVLDGNESLSSMLIVIIMYFVLTLISVVVDRRAFMVSSLVYVLYALSNLLELYGVVGYSFAITGVCIGAALLILTAFWHAVRAYIVSMLPLIIKAYVPEIKN